MAEEKKKKNLKKFIKTFIACFSAFVVTSAIISTITILHSDKNRFDSSINEIKTNEIIKKNYVNGFDKVGTSGKFNFALPEADINAILKGGAKSIKNNAVEAVYYGKNTGNHHYFYVDLKKSFVTSRIIIDTIASVSKKNKINLKVAKITRGKVDGEKFAKRKGILTSDFFDKYFKTCDLPITYKEKSKTFVFDALKLIDKFPKSQDANKSIGFNVVKAAMSIGDPVLKLDGSNLGFTVDFSKMRSSSSLTVVNTDDDITTVADEIEVICKSADTVSLISDNQPHTVYSIADDDLNIGLSKSVPSDLKEIVTYSNKSIENKLISLNTSFSTVDGFDYLNLHLAYSLNGYLIDAVMPLEFSENSSNTSFIASFEYQYTVHFGNSIFEDIEDPCVEFCLDNLRSVFANLYSKLASAFAYNEDNDYLSFNFSGITTDNGYPSQVAGATKSVELSSNSIDIVLDAN